MWIKLFIIKQLCFTEIQCICERKEMSKGHGLVYLVLTPDYRMDSFGIFHFLNKYVTKIKLIIWQMHETKTKIIIFIFISFLVRLWNGSLQSISV